MPILSLINPPREELQERVWPRVNEKFVMFPFPVSASKKILSGQLKHFFPLMLHRAPRARSKTTFMLEGQVVKVDVKTLKVYYLPQLPLFCEGVKRDFFPFSAQQSRKNRFLKTFSTPFLKRDTFAPFLPTMRAKKHHFHRTKDLVNSIFDKYFLPASR